ncbi:hypothetical protein PISMIDRAFT_684518 [Pisolithus microcarpus 441]|uniref:Uncharacterized protein n=1 Tax=Pisolithus microcarpus 441 TaxID=765257 RepID=A0A0C9Y016_9AGAM|nr:hypothetical protein PISMIDRAFT_684518 [Pisolithus microcarpus 441]
MCCTWYTPSHKCSHSKADHDPPVRNGPPASVTCTATRCAFASALNEFFGVSHTPC